MAIAHTTMKLSWRIYALLVAVFVASIAAATFVQLGVLGRTLLPMPAILSLLGILYQIARDEAAHAKHLAIQRDQQFFDLGITSHMADVAFDKHVAFCEEYVAELHATLQTFWRLAETKLAITHANNLVAIRRKYAVWLTPEIEAQLDPIDLALRKLGSTAWLKERASGAPVTPSRFEEMYNLFGDIVGLAADPNRQMDKEIAITNVIARIRDVLGVPQLLKVRRHLLELHEAPHSASEASPVQAV
jgi:hypothetical protein